MLYVFMIPLLMMTAIYIRIYFIISGNQRQKHKQQQCLRQASIAAGSCPAQDVAGGRRSQPIKQPSTDDDNCDDATVWLDKGTFALNEDEDDDNDNDERGSTSAAAATTTTTTSAQDEAAAKCAARLPLLESISDNDDHDHHIGQLDDSADENKAVANSTLPHRANHMGHKSAITNRKLKSQFSPQDNHNSKPPTTSATAPALRASDTQAERLPPIEVRRMRLLRWRTHHASITHPKLDKPTDEHSSSPDAKTKRQAPNSGSTRPFSLILRSNTIGANHLHSTKSLYDLHGTRLRASPSLYASSVALAAASCKREQSTRRQPNTKALVTTLLILGTYLISYAPTIVLNMLTCVDGCVLPMTQISFARRLVLNSICSFLLIIKAIIDPLIYSYRMGDIQEALNKYLGHFWLCGRLASKASPPTTSMAQQQQANKTNSTLASPSFRSNKLSKQISLTNSLANRSPANHRTLIASSQATEAISNSSFSRQHSIHNSQV